MHAFGVDRVLFGSNFPYHDPLRSLETLEHAGLTAGELDLVTTDNAVRLFGA